MNTEFKTVELLSLVHDHINNVDEDVQLAAVEVLSYIIPHSIKSRVTIIEARDKALLPRIKLLMTAEINDAPEEYEPEVA